MNERTLRTTPTPTKIDLLEEALPLVRLVLADTPLHSVRIGITNRLTGHGDDLETEPVVRVTAYPALGSRHELMDVLVGEGADLGPDGWYGNPPQADLEVRLATLAGGWPLWLRMHVSDDEWARYQRRAGE